MPSKTKTKTPASEMKISCSSNIEDVKTFNPDMTDKEAMEFLEENGRYIRDAVHAAEIDAELAVARSLKKGIR